MMTLQLFSLIYKHISGAVISMKKQTTHTWFFYHCIEIISQLLPVLLIESQLGKKYFH